MVMVTGAFEQVAAALVQRTADLLGASVVAQDEHGSIIARAGQAPLADGTGTLRVPLVLDGHALAVAIGRPDGGVLDPDLTRVIVNLVLDQAAVLDRLPHQQLLKSRFVLDLLRGSDDDPADVMREAQLLGMDLGRPRAVLLIDASEYILGSRTGTDRQDLLRARLVISSIVRFFTLPDETICAYIGDGEVAVLKASATQDLSPWAEPDGGERHDPPWANLTALKRAATDLLAHLRRDTGAAVTVGIGRYHPSLRGLARSHDDARLALSLGARVHGSNRVHCLDGLGVAAFLGIADERMKLDLARHLLSPLDHEPELIETLDAFFAEDCYPSAAANRLQIHRNTLGYRLEKVAALTGLDPRRFDDAVQLRLALVLRSLHDGDGRLCNPTITGSRRGPALGKRPMPEARHSA
jgi:carbohydrate diacid regulator